MRKQYLDLCADIQRRKELRYRQETGQKKWHERRREASLLNVLALIAILFLFAMIALLTV